MDTVNFQLHFPSSVVLVAPSGMGKTFLTAEIVKRRKEIIEKPIDRVVYVFNSWQDKLRELKASDPNITFTDRIEDLEEPIKEPTLIIVDDFQQEISKKGRANDIITSFFIRRIHHDACVLILLLQNAFKPLFRDITINSQYLGIFSQPRDKGVVISLARQIMPSQTRFLCEAFERAVTKRKFGYLWMTFHPQDMTSRFWCRSDIFPTSDCEIYVP